MVADNLNGLISEATFMAVLESYGFETCFCQKHFITWAKVFRRSANQPYGDLSSNPAKVYSFFLNKCCLNRTKMSKKRLRLTQFLTLNRDQNCRVCEKYEKTKGRNYLTGAESKKCSLQLNVRFLASDPRQLPERRYFLCTKYIARLLLHCLSASVEKNTEKVD